MTDKNTRLRAALYGSRIVTATLRKRPGQIGATDADHPLRREPWAFASVARMEVRLRRWDLSLVMVCSIAAHCLGEASFLQALPALAWVRRSPVPPPSH